MQEACVTPHGRWNLGPDVELGWTLPAGTLTTLSAVPIPCHADGHGKPRVTSSWTVSDLDVGPDRGSSRRSANLCTNRMSAGGPGDL